MKSQRMCSLFPRIRIIGLALLLACFVGPTTTSLFADQTRPKTAASSKDIPENVDDLKAIQKQVKEVLEKVVPCTVGVRIGGAQGSGVVISKEGHVLTAGHVSGQPDREVILTFPDGKKVKGKTLGANRGIDSGLVKITDEGAWPFVDMGNSADLKAGQWCIALGHPGGYKTGRSPVVRLGRILNVNGIAIQSDCTLVGGDSGGPLFDLKGKVVGIHSRIGGPITANIHVPVDTYRDTWDRLARGDAWGGQGGNNNGAFLGVRPDLESKGCKISEIVEGSPAEKIGLKANDIVTLFDGAKIASFDDLTEQVSKKKPGDEVTLEVRRREETLRLKVVLGKRG